MEPAALVSISTPAHKIIFHEDLDISTLLLTAIDESRALYSPLRMTMPVWIARPREGASSAGYGLPAALARRTEGQREGVSD
jgi:hypothetical protein